MALSTDSFTRADNASSLGSTDGGTLGPLAWTAHSGTWGIISNQAYESAALGLNFRTATVDLATADVDISIDTDRGITFRLTDANNYWRFHQNGAFTIDKVVAGTPTTLGTSAGSSSGTWRVVADGPSISCYLNGVLKFSVVDTFNQTATRHGLLAYGTTLGRMDNWTANSLGADEGVFPTLNVLIGFLASSASVGTGPYMTFNDSQYGLFNTGTFAPDYVWADVTSDVRSLNVTRGRQRQIEAFASGNLSMELDNNAGNYDPDNTNSIYYVGGTTSVLPMRPVSVSASWNGVNYPIFFGYIDAFVPNYSPGQFSDATCTVTASDAMKVLQNIPSSGTAPAELTGARINRILDNAGWPAGLRTIAAGDVTLQATTLAATAAQDIQNSVDSEYGRWYIGTNGYVIFENRSSRSAHQTAIATWSDTDTNGNLYSDINRVIDDDLIRNQVSIQRNGGVAQVLTDATSITQYQARSFTASNLLLTSDSDAYQLANLILYYGKQLVGTRFDMVEFQPATGIAAGAAGDLWPEVLGRAISDRISVVVTPPRVAPMTMGAFVEGMSHTITTEPQGWITTFHASRSAPTNFIQFDDPVFGITFAASAASGNTFGN